MYIHLPIYIHIYLLIYKVISIHCVLLFPCRKLSLATPSPAKPSAKSTAQYLPSPSEDLSILSPPLEVPNPKVAPPSSDTVWFVAGPEDCTVTQGRTLRLVCQVNTKRPMGNFFILIVCSFICLCVYLFIHMHVDFLERLFLYVVLYSEALVYENLGGIGQWLKEVGAYMLSYIVHIPRIEK